jgi:hypothetical protein
MLVRISFRYKIISATNKIWLHHAGDESDELSKFKVIHDIVTT